MPSPRRFAFGLLLTALIIAVGCLVWGIRSAQFPISSWLPPRRVRLERPAGMAPIAFDAFIRACVATKIHPARISQTLGNDPRSVGYHLQDGVLNLRGEKIPYCAAIDVSARDLDRATTLRFVRELGRQGFAAWYREGPKWKNGEHIHAVYAFLPMKRQLRGQVLSYLREQREDGTPIWWEKKLRRTRHFRKYF